MGYFSFNVLLVCLMALAVTSTFGQMGYYGNQMYSGYNSSLGLGVNRFGNYGTSMASTA
ncbi:hypothetical protein RvY_15087-2 [Ramazzottius varieornatus]|uniref:Uncharacterized protein n=1 Tax=Ramazzottius varieornatus TaxID=947166 RepID=A0A1D1W1V9_RAMVA|nr:hypothetical protein RvY_15087-2 [Ramazzottius varieornatus]